MASDPSMSSAVRTFTVAEFWDWLEQHTHCVLRVGTQEGGLFDHELLHWSFSENQPDTWYVQLNLGKRVIGELVVFTGQVSQVVVSNREGEEHLFEFVAQLPSGPVSVAHFVLTHGPDGGEELPDDDWVN